ncbi:MAG: sigma-70 family RNA polymerase sigma factor [bacterium]|nr:sigma-70 family RNA polymerase sigma factor [bacterium]
MRARERLPAAAGADRGATDNQILGALSYVPVVARRYRGCGVPTDDLVAAGNLGLLEAAIRFDPGREVRFVTYATWWIRKAILEALEEQSGPLGLPRHQHERLRRLARTRREWISSHGEEPTEEELLRAASLSRLQARRVAHLTTGSVSLEQPVGDADGPPLSDLLPDSGSENPQLSIIRRDLATKVRDHLSRLDAREREVISLRFGLGGGTPLTLREAGSRLKLSRERVRQIELRALLELRRLL